MEKILEEFQKSEGPRNLKENRKRRHEELKQHLLNAPLDSETDTEDDNEDGRKKRRLRQNPAKIENRAHPGSYKNDVRKLNKWRRKITKATSSARKKQKKIRKYRKKSATFTEDDSDDPVEIANPAQRRSYNYGLFQLEKCRNRISLTRRSTAKKRKKILEEYQKAVKYDIDYYLRQKDRLHNKFQMFLVSNEEDLPFKEGDILVRKKSSYRTIRELRDLQMHFLFIHRASALTVTYSILPSKPVAFCSESQWRQRRRLCLQPKNSTGFPSYGVPRTARPITFACGHLVSPNSGETYAICDHFEGENFGKSAHRGRDCPYCEHQPSFAGPDENKVGVKKFQRGLRWTQDVVPYIEGPNSESWSRGRYMLWSRSKDDCPLLAFPAARTFQWQKKVIEEGLESETLPTVLVDLIAEFTYRAKETEGQIFM